MYIKRDMSNGAWSSGGAKWAFFAVFIVFLLILVFGTMRVNKKRSRNGTQPIYGTRWLTPPSYRQSETQHNPNGSDPATGAYVPTYTATANEHDMGYYDNTGEFHANPNAKLAGTNAQNPISSVPPAHHRQTSDVNDVGPATEILDTIGQNDSDGEDLYRRPMGAPPSRASTGTGFPSPSLPRPNSDATADTHAPTYMPPSSPPPGEHTYSTPLAPPAEGSSLDNTESLPSFTEGSNPPIVREK